VQRSSALTSLFAERASGSPVRLPEGCLSSSTQQMARNPRHHWIPQSVLGAWVVQGKGIPWNDAETGEHVRYDSVPETAQVRGGNWAVVPQTGRMVSTEEQWTRYFDDAIGSFVKRLRDAPFDSDEMCESALGLVPGMAGLTFRSPAAAESRLDAVLSLHEVLRAAIRVGTDLREAVANHLGIARKEVVNLGLLTRSFGGSPRRNPSPTRTHCTMSSLGPSSRQCSPAINGLSLSQFL
jgi:hypothetical protein